MSLSNYIINQDAPLLDALKQLDKQSQNLSLTLLVVNSDMKVLGTITDGDCRRAIINGKGLFDKVNEFLNPHFTYIEEGIFDLAKHQFIKDNRFKLVPVLDKNGVLLRVFNFADKKAYLPIDAVLMAGGKGERLRPLTEETPKPLLPVGNKAIIDYNIDNLIAYGIEHLFVTVNYLKDQLENHFAQPRKDGIQVTCVCEPEYLGTIGSVKFVKNWYNDSILIMNSDLFTNINLEEFFIHFKEHDADMSIAAVPYSVNIPYGILEIENTRDIIGVKEKPNYHYYANAGIYLIKREILSKIPDGKFFNATDLMQQLISTNNKVIRFPLSGYWIDIGKHEDYKKAQEFVKHL